MLIEQLKLSSDEVILLLVRKHWFILLSKTIGIILAGIVPVVLLTSLADFSAISTLSLSDALLSKLSLFLSACWILIVWMVLFGIWTDYYLDTWIITNERVIAIDQQGFFHRHISSFRMERLQDLHVYIRGIIQTIFNFGTIEAETASHTDAFIIRGAPKPRDIKALIQENTDKILAAQRVVSVEPSSRAPQADSGAR